MLFNFFWGGGGSLEDKRETLFQHCIETNIFSFKSTNPGMQVQFTNKTQSGYCKTTQTFTILNP